ncbi:MFS transporter [Paenibacillus sp. UNC499MF]|uniref:MFS transporter n=1 Tax=Paenibacillus sp. UNC499MF TaxID=1502751 RepID=UPI0008A0159A|nr:MFS transporter [Paenibacillus sp. UNC499MF]SEG79512.1 Major Facilitator Superfamily protein [Paenibacillus sp. UNC499MF]
MFSFRSSNTSMTTGVRRFLATEALYGIGIGLYSLALNLHLLALGASGGQIASISAVGILIMGIGALPAGMLAGKIGRKPMLLAGSMLVAAGAALFATGRSLPVWYTAQAVASAGFMCIETTEIQLLFRYCRSRREESRAFHGMFAVFTAFTGLGNLLGGILSRADASAAGHAPSLYASAICIAVLSLLRLRLLPSERAAGGSGGGGETTPATGGIGDDDLPAAAEPTGSGARPGTAADSRGRDTTHSSIADGELPALAAAAKTAGSETYAPADRGTASGSATAAKDNNRNRVLADAAAGSPPDSATGNSGEGERHALRKNLANSPVTGDSDAEERHTSHKSSANPPVSRGKRPAESLPRMPQAIRRLLRNRSLWLLAANACLIGFVFSFIGPFMNVYLKFRAAWEDDLISYVYTVNGLVLFAASLAAPKIMERWGAKAAFTGAFLGNAGLAFLLLIAQPAPVFAALLVLRSGSFSLLGNLVDSETMSSLREEDRNLYAGMRAVFRCVGSSLSTMTAGFFMNAGDYHTPFLIAGVLLIVNYIYFRSRVLPLIKRDENLRGEPQAGGA